MSKSKKSFALRLSPETFKELEKWAQDEFRSTNGQIEYILSDAIKKRKGFRQKKESEK